MNEPPPVLHRGTMNSWPSGYTAASGRVAHPPRGVEVSTRSPDPSQFCHADREHDRHELAASEGAGDRGRVGAPGTG